MSKLTWCFTCGRDCDADLGEPYTPMKIIGSFWYKRLPDKHGSEDAYRAAWYTTSQSRCRWRQLKKLGASMTKLYCDPYLQGSVKPGWQERLAFDE